LSEGFPFGKKKSEFEIEGNISNINEKITVILNIFFLPDYYKLFIINRLKGF
jgi:hypothetical protein